MNMKVGWGLCCFALLIAGCATSSKTRTPILVTGPKKSEKEHAQTRVATRKPLTGEKRWFALDQWAIDDALVGNLAKAKSEGNELLAGAEKHKNDFSYGNAIHRGNIALGLVALQQGNTNDAKKYLMLAARTPGSPQLDSFGPDTTLAKQLLDRGEKAAVVDYLAQCGSFYRGAELQRWIQQIHSGQTPSHWR